MQFYSVTTELLSKFSWSSVVYSVDKCVYCDLYPFTQLISLAACVARWYSRKKANLN